MSIFRALATLCGDPIDDMARILSLPNIGLSQAYDWTSYLKRPNGKWTLNDVQNRILTAAYTVGGCVAFAPVGSGKSLACFCLPTVLNAQRAIVLQPGAMRSDWHNERLTYSRQFTDPGHRLEAISYTQLAQPSGSDLLTRMRPDLIIADESDKLATLTGRALARIVRYVIDNPTTRFIAMSGSVDSNSVRKMFHLFALALRAQSPMPCTWLLVDSLAQAVDPDRKEPSDIACEKWAPLASRMGVDAEDRTSIRLAMQERLRRSPGVVLVDQTSYQGDVRILTRKVEIPDLVNQWLSYVDRTWVDPEGFEFASHLDFSRKMSELAQGFFYVTNWPLHGCRDDCQYRVNGIECKNGYLVDAAWLETRRAWNRAVRQYMPDAGEGTDSDALAANASEKWLSHWQGGPRPRREVPPYVIEAWQAWRDHKRKTPPGNRTVWLSDFLAQDAKNWLLSQKTPAIIWVKHAAMAERIAAVCGIQAIGAGDDANATLVEICKRKDLPSLCLSLAAHGRGKNLQRYARGLVMSPPASGPVFEQLIGRFARMNQLSPDVELTVYDHTKLNRKALDDARADAEYSAQLTGATRLFLKGLQAC